MKAKEMERILESLLATFWEKNLYYKPIIQEVTAGATSMDLTCNKCGFAAEYIEFKYLCKSG